MRILATSGTPSAAETLVGQCATPDQPIPIRQRLGQGTFRVMITEAFDRIASP